MQSNRKRVKILKNGTREGGKVVLVPHTWEDFLNVASGKLLINAVRVYDADGFELDSIDLLRDDDVVYIAGEEPFKTVRKAESDVPHGKARATSGSYESKTHDVIKLNIGGTFFSTTRSTLLKEPKSELAKLLDKKDFNSSDDEYFIDRNPKYFEYILDYLRYGVLMFKDSIISDLVFKEAAFFGIDSLVAKWKDVTTCAKDSSSHSQTVPSSASFKTVETVSDGTKSMGDVVQLNVGGKLFTTSRATLCKEPDSMLAKMFDPDLQMNSSKQDNSGAFFIDRNGTYFEYILEYLRSGKLAVTKHARRDLFLDEAKFYGIDSLINSWDKLALYFEKYASRTDMIHFLNSSISVDPKPSLKYSQFDFANLSGMHYEGIDFSNSSFRGCVLNNTIFDNCNVNGANFKDASMQCVTFQNNTSDCFSSDVNFEGANLENVKFMVDNVMKCNFQNSCLKFAYYDGVTFEFCNFCNASLEHIVYVPEDSDDELDYYCYYDRRTLSRASPTFKNCDFTNATLTNFWAPEISDSKFLKAKLSWTCGAFFDKATNCDFSGGNFTGLQLCNARRCNFSDSNFKNSLLSNLYFPDDSLKGANLNRAYFTECKFQELPRREANIYEYECNERWYDSSNFANANFTGAEFQECCLPISTLKNAKFEGAKLSDDILQELYR